MIIHRLRQQIMSTHHTQMKPLGCVLSSEANYCKCKGITGLALDYMDRSFLSPNANLFNSSPYLF